MAKVYSPDFMNYEKLDIILSKLKIIAKLEPTEKIIFNDHTIEVVDFTTYNMMRVKKWYHEETRVSIRQKIKDFYRDIEEFAGTLINNPPSFISKEDIDIVLDRLCKNLKESINGIKNLNISYNEDKTTRSELETVQERINITVSKIERALSGRSSPLLINETAAETSLPTSLSSSPNIHTPQQSPAINNKKRGKNHN